MIGSMTNEDVIKQLRKDLEALEANGQISDYQRNLLKWTKNVDRRYAWVVLVAAHLMLMGTLGPYRAYGLIFAVTAKEGVYTREQASWPVTMIFTLETLVGPLVSIIVYYTSFRTSKLIGALLICLSNLAAYYSNSIFLDTLFIGVVQGIGYAFLFTPLLETLNGYFVKNRSFAFGMALCGGTVSNFILLPIFQWILANYQWRTGYFGTFCVSLLTVLMIPFMKSNIRPKPPITPQHTIPLENVNNSDHRPSRSADPNQTQSTRKVSRQASVVSINSFATVEQNQKVSTNFKLTNVTTGEAKMDAKLAQGFSNQLASPSKTELNSTLSSQSPLSCATINNSEQTSLNNVLNSDKQASEPTGSTDFHVALIWNMIKAPAFHLICLIDVLYSWLFSIMCLIIVDFGVDHKLTKSEAESLLGFISIGELIGRLFLSHLADLNLVSNRKIIISDLILLSLALVLITQTNSYYGIAACSLILFAFTSFLYILMNVLLVEYLGERQVTLGYGFASFIGGALIIPRPYAVGYFRDNLGSYDGLMICMAAFCLTMAAFWIIEPWMTKLTHTRIRQQEENIETV